MQFPHIDPVFLSIGPLQFRWYGLMYVLAFIATYFILSSEVRRKQHPLTRDDVADLVFYGAMGVVLGGRLGYILFYDLKVYLADPLQVFAVWKGGMSFHGGFLGVVLSFVLFARRKGISFWALIDMAAQCAPVGLGLGRIGNFINGELYGRPTDVPWGMVFPGGGGMPRHPSQLYEAFLEGLLLFFVVRFMSRRSDVTGIPAWTFCAGYGLFRFVVELFRQPDAQIGFFLNFFSMGQLLSLPMFLVGSFMVFRLSRRSA
ncbi:prolipoprotein diacylglyceryl transferase [Geobacter sp. FeAm09]|uniref:prolipoprotein diacylglyceryl transferase n=1 Tax=Geobacter sp. FeAm09 TaxID=2597769 RepID=UPI0011ED769A|nr:prolipoprotein diacylglyceryl transferase [Geobacter sp. FeAm09]QEM68609.1 prolipoprotein diacylglyceryl transferase [Geobacter sp. FeAm09]